MEQQKGREQGFFDGFSCESQENIKRPPKNRPFSSERSPEQTRMTTETTGQDIVISLREVRDALAANPGDAGLVAREEELVREGTLMLVESLIFVHDFGHRMQTGPIGRMLERRPYSLPTPISRGKSTGEEEGGTAGSG
jgi:hypothetical protein